jgi:long-subunit acyl-CoA synthetase (AMP-forming)
VPNQKVILTGETSGEYVLTSLAIMMAGGVVVGVHTGFLPSQILTIINHV